MNRRAYTQNQMFLTRLQAGTPRPMASLLREVDRCRMFALDADHAASMIDAAINVFVMGTRAAHAYREAQRRDERVMRLGHGFIKLP